MNNKAEIWKKAYTIYHEMIGKPREHALQEIDNNKNLSQEVKKIVLQLFASELEINDADTDNFIKISDINIDQKFNISINQVIDQYKILEKIGDGGMSLVFKATRLNFKNQKPVAIKINPPNSNQKVHKKFIEEQEILSKLSHPNIINLHHGGISSDGMSFLVMDYIENSKSLDQYITSNNLTIRQIIKLIIQIGKALTYAHNNFVIHRDIKPSNILINDKQELKILDFGIAKNTLNVINEEQTLMAFTPEFAAPEQIQNQQATVATDIFSLALVTLTLLNKSKVIKRPRLQSNNDKDESDITNVLKEIQIDKDLKNILTKALKISPIERYSSMSKFTDDMISWLRNMPVSATPDSLFYQFKKLAKRRSGVFIALTGIFSILSLSVFVLNHQNQLIKAEANKSKQVKQFLLNTFESWDPDVLKGDELSTKDRLELTASDILSNTQLDADTRVELLQTLAEALGKLGFYDAAIEYLNKSLEIVPFNGYSLSQKAYYLFESGQTSELENLLGSNASASFTDVNHLAQFQRVKARYLAKQAEFETALQLIEEIKTYKYIQGEMIESIQTGMAEADINFLASNPDKAVEILEKLILQFGNQASPTLIFKIKMFLGDMLNKTGNFPEAANKLEQLIADQHKILGTDHPQLIQTYRFISESYRQQGNYPGAELYAKKAYALAKQLFGAKALITGHALSSLSVMPHQRNYQITEDQMTEVVEIYTLHLGEDHPQTLEAKYNLAGAYRYNRKRSEGLKLIKPVWEKQKEILGINHDSTLHSQKELSYAYMVNNNCPKAMKTVNDAAQVAKENYGWEHSVTPIMVYAQGVIHSSCTGHKKALEYFFEIEDHREFLIGNRILPNTYKRIANSYQSNSNHLKAEEYFLKSIELFQSTFGVNSDTTLAAEISYIKLLELLNRKEESEQLKSSILSKYNAADPNHVILFNKHKDTLQL